MFLNNFNHFESHKKEDAVFCESTFTNICICMLYVNTRIYKYISHNDIYTHTYIFTYIHIHTWTLDTWPTYSYSTCLTTFFLIAANPHDYTIHDDSNMLKEKSYSGCLTVYDTIAIIVTRGDIIALKMIAIGKEHGTIVWFDKICLMKKQTQVIALRREASLGQQLINISQ